MNHIKLFESFHKSQQNKNQSQLHGINYDSTLEIELKDMIGDLDRLIPYILDLPHINDKVDIQQDSSGKIHVTDVSSKKSIIYRNIKEFLSKIGYRPVYIKDR